MKPEVVYLCELEKYWAIRVDPNNRSKLGYISKNTNNPGYVAIHDPENFQINGVNWTFIDREPINAGQERYIFDFGTFDNFIKTVRNSCIEIIIPVNYLIRY